MKKVHILTQEENKLSSKQLEEYMEFAAKNNYELTGELHFHFSNAFYEPEKFVNTIKDLTTSRTFVTDGECIVFANAFNDGRLLKAFEDMALKSMNVTVVVSFRMCSMNSTKDRFIL